MTLLSNIEQLINTNIETNSHQPPTAQLLSTLKTEKEKIISKFEKIICKGNGKKLSHITLYQYRILDLMETISNQLPQELYIQSPSNNHLLLLYHTLHDLHIFLEKTCAASLDFRYKVPFIYLLSARQAFSEALPILRENLSSFEVNNILQDIILKPFEEVIETAHISFHRLYYLKALSKQIQHLQPGSTAEHVAALLIYMNFNSEQYLAYQQTVITEKIESYTTAQEQLEQTQWLLKTNNRQLEHPHYQYTDLFPSLKEQISDWLTHESVYLEHKIHYLKHTPLPAEVAKWQSFKIKINLSVNELGYLLRLLMEYNLIQNENRTAVVDFFAHYFSTNNQHAISATSLRQKLYSFPSSSSDSVRSWLMGLYNKSKQLKTG